MTRAVLMVVAWALWGTVSGPAFAQEPLKLGLVAPVSGPIAIFGAEVLRGARLAVETLNQGGGIDGRKIELLTEDDECSPSRASEKTRALIDREKVHGLIGSICGGSALAGAQYAESADVLTLALSSAPNLTGPDRPILRVIGRDDRLARATADYVEVNFKGRRVGLLARATPFGTALREQMERRGTRLDKAELISVPIDAPPDWLGSVDVAVLYQVPPAALDRDFPGRTALVIPAIVVDPAIGSLLKRSNLVVISNPRPDFFEGALELLRRGRIEQPENSGYTIYAYAAVQLFASLARQARGNFGGRSLVRLAREATSATAIGQLRFDANGDIIGWRFAAYGAASGPDVCQSPQCRDYEQCPKDCPK